MSENEDNDTLLMAISKKQKFGKEKEKVTYMELLEDKEFLKGLASNEFFVNILREKLLPKTPEKFLNLTKDLFFSYSTANHELLKSLWEKFEQGPYPQSQINDWFSNYRSGVLKTVRQKPTCEWFTAFSHVRSDFFSKAFGSMDDEEKDLIKPWFAEFKKRVGDQPTTQQKSEDLWGKMPLQLTSEKFTKILERHYDQ